MADVRPGKHVRTQALPFAQQGQAANSTTSEIELSKVFLGTFLGCLVAGKHFEVDFLTKICKKLVKCYEILQNCKISTAVGFRRVPLVLLRKT